MENRNLHAAIEVHSVNTNRRIIFDAQIDMFADAETEIASLREVPPLQFVLFDFQASLEDFFGLGTTDGDMDGNLLVTADTECSNGVSGFACSERKTLLSDNMPTVAGSFTPGQEMGRGLRSWRTIDGCLTAQLLKHFGSTSQPVTRFADGDVKDEFLDAEFAHRISALVSARVRLFRSIVISILLSSRIKGICY